METVVPYIAYCIPAKVPRKSYAAPGLLCPPNPRWKTRNYLLRSGVGILRRLAQSLHIGVGRKAKVMESVVSFEIRQLCKAVSEEENSERLKVLLDDLLRVLDERQLVAALF